MERFEGIYKKSSLPNKVVVQYVLSVVTHYGHVTGTIYFICHPQVPWDVN